MNVCDQIKSIRVLIVGGGGGGGNGFFLKIGQFLLLFFSHSNSNEKDRLNLNYINS